jgi:UDP-N-acetylmuramate--alanine ligase
MNLTEAQTIGMIGIGGSGMRGLAYLLAATGKNIIGTDSDISKLASDPDINTYTIAAEHDALPLFVNVDVIIYSDAVPPEHPLREAGQLAGKTEYMYSQAVGQYLQRYTTIAVTGTHGKSSTTAMLSHILTEVGLDPTVVVGAPIPAWQNRNARLGHSNYAVVEADEYRKHFLDLHPTHVIVTSIDFDHPDFFHSLEDVTQAYSQFLAKVPADGLVVTPRSVYEQYPHVAWPSQTKLVDLPENPIFLQLPGQHMQQNAALALAIATQLGVDQTRAIVALKTFPGLGRRFETVGEVNKMRVISDYGHHPEEIAATVRGTRERFPNDKIVALIEPHTSERLDTLFDEYVKVLKAAAVDALVICPTFIAKGRAVAAPDRHDELYAKLRQAKPETVWELPDYAELPQLMKKLSAEYDVAIGFTAGSLDAYLRQL